MCNNISTVAELIKLKDFSKHATLITKNSDLSRVVSHVTIMEAPDLNEWVTGGEFVLTTWYSFSQNSTIAEESFKKLAPKIAAIGIKTHRFIDQIPKNIIKIAEQFHLPIFEIKRHTLFRNMVNIIANQIQNYQLNMLAEAEIFYKELIEASAYNDDINKILSLLSTKIHQPVCLMNNDLRVIAQKGKLISKDNLQIVRAHLSECFLIPNNFIISNTVDNLAIFPCFIRQKIVGFLIVPKETLKSERYKLTCQQSTSFLSVRLWSLYEDAQKNQLSFIQQLSSNESISKEYLCSKINKLELDPTKNMVVCLIHATDIITILYSYLNLKISSKILIHNNNEILLIYNSNQALDILKSLPKILKGEKDKFIIVHSNPTNDIEILRNYYKLALNSLEVFKHMKLYGIRKIDDLPLHTMLYGMKDSSSYQYMKDNILLPIVKFDNEYKGELLKSLYVYTTFDSLSKSAEYLHIHVNTLRYRLEKLREITGKNINDTKHKRELVFVSVIADLENFISDDWRIDYNIENYDH